MTGWQVLATIATTTIAIVAVVSLIRNSIRDFRRELEGKVEGISNRLRELETSTARFRGETEAKLEPKSVNDLAAKLVKAMREENSA